MVIFHSFLYVSQRVNHGITWPRSRHQSHQSLSLPNLQGQRPSTEQAEAACPFSSVGFSHLGSRKTNKKNGKNHEKSMKKNEVEVSDFQWKTEDV
jgi:hypothetical protein